MELVGRLQKLADGSISTIIVEHLDEAAATDPFSASIVPASTISPITKGVV